MSERCVVCQCRPEWESSWREVYCDCYRTTGETESIALRAWCRWQDGVLRRAAKEIERRKHLKPERR